MGDVDDAHTPVTEHIDDLEQMLHFFLCQRGGRLVENDDLGIVGNRLGDLHHLPLRNRHGGHDPLGIHLDAQLIEDGHGIVVHFLFLDETGSGGIAAQPDVIHHIALQRLVQLLMHHGNTVVQGFPAAPEVDLLAFQIDMASILDIHAKQALHQSGFACTVLAHQCVNSTAVNRQRNLIQCLDTREGFADFRHLQQNILLHIAFLLA